MADLITDSKGSIALFSLLDCSRSSIWDDDPPSEVWWGEDGIDAPIWADREPYAEPLTDVSAEVAVPLLAGDRR
jgi:hypothetical protein